MDITGKTAIVTGGARGIGRGIALVLASNGADVVVADIIKDEAREVTTEVEARGRQAMACGVDVTDQDSVNCMVQDTIDRFGRIDILVNNAGTVGAPGWEQRQETTEEDWDMSYEVNVKGTVRVTGAVAGHMKQRRYGKIINVSSVAGRQGQPFSPAYSVSKAGVISFTQASALELAPYDVNVNAICPGLIWSPLWERIADRRSALFEDFEGLSPREVFDKVVRDSTPLKRGQTPEDMGYLAAFLASDYARNITGQAINVSGGSRMD